MSQDYKFSNNIISGNSWSNGNLKLTKLKNQNLKVSIGKISIQIPLKLFSKFSHQLSGSITYDKQKFELHPKRVKDAGYCTITITPLKGKPTTCEPLWFCHYNTSVYHGFTNFLKGLSETFSVAYCPVQNCLSSYICTYDGSSREYYQAGSYALDQTEEIKKQIQSFIKNGTQPLLVESKSRLEKILNITLPADRVFDFESVLEMPWSQRHEKLLQQPLGRGFLHGGQKSFDMTRWYSELYLTKNKTLPEIKKEFLLET